MNKVNVLVAALIGRGLWVPAFAGNWIQNGDFHVYRIVTEGKDIKVYVDGELRLNAPGAYVKASTANLNQIAFGASDSTNVSEACWDYVRAKVDSQSCQDVVLRVAYPKK